MRNRDKGMGMLGRAYQWLALLAIGFLLSACGGGGGDPTIDGGGTGNGGNSGVAATVTVSLLDADGKASNTVNVAAPLTARAVVLDKNGTGVANVLVTFSVEAGLVALTPASGTALTDAKGVAVVTMRPVNNTVTGAGKVTASVTNGSATVAGEANYQISAATASKASISVSLLNASGNPSNTLSNAAPLTGVAVVKDQNGAVLADALVVFASNDNALAVLSPSNGSVLTDKNGEARVILRPVSLAAAGAGTLTAAVVFNGATSSSTVNYVVGATALTFGNIVLSNPALDAYGSTEVAVDVLSNGVKYTDQSVAVRFSSSCVASGKASFANVVQTANGSARATYRDQGCGVNDVISAAADGVTGGRSATVQIAPPQPASIQFTSAVPSDKSIVIRGQGGLLRSETATLKFRAFDTFNNPLQGLRVIFEKADANAEVDLAPQDGTTDANGEVTTSVSSRDTPLSFRIRAKFTSAGREVSTLSDTIVVSTGTPVQKAFSLSISDSNVEGLDVDANGTAPSATVTVAMGDRFGNPVADGTPVVFQSNVGVVGTASRGGCNSVNGACSVDFRSQAPRTPVPNVPATVCNRVVDDSRRPGVATICASTSDGTAVPIFGRISFFISGSKPGQVLLDGTTVVNDKDGVHDLGVVSWAVPKVFTLKISDVNGNPMPSGTRIEVANITGASTSGVSPPTVQMIFPDATVADTVKLGSSHIVTISAPAEPCTPKVGTFNINVITPRLLTTSYPFKLTFKCE